MTNFNQPKCVECWTRENPGRIVHRIVEAYREQEKCSSCGNPTRSGIYVRQHPDLVMFPAPDEEDA